MNADERHDDVVELLPWLVNGTLPEGERARVERHVRACLTCYAALQQERRVRSAVRDAAPGQAPAAGQSFERLVPALDAEASASAPRPARRNALAAAAALVALAAGVLLWAGLGSGPPTGPVFETAADAPAQGPALDLVFSERLAEAEMRALLNELDATIVAGPTEIGRYTVQLERSMTDAELAALVARLMQDERVRFAGRSFIGERDRERP